MTTAGSCPRRGRSRLRDGCCRRLADQPVREVSLNRRTPRADRRNMGLIAVQIFFRRLLLALPIVLCVSALVFVILRLLPADPVSMSLPPGATPADFERLKHELGLDRSIPVQYLIWLGKFLTGDLGGSI